MVLAFERQLMKRRIAILIAVFVGATALALQNQAFAATSEPTDQRVDPAPCVAAIMANDDDQIITICSPLIDNEKTARDDRIKALTARAEVYDRRDMIDRAIGDYDIVLRLDPTLADIHNARGELRRKKGDRPGALADFAAAIKLNPAHAAAKASYKALALEVERLGAMMAVNNKPSFNCATAKRAVDKAICANPELANLDREINAVNTKVVRQATNESPRAGRAMQGEQDDFIARRNAAYGRADYDLQKAMRERLDHLRALERP